MIGLIILIVLGVVFFFGEIGITINNTHYNKPFMSVKFNKL